MTALLIVAGYLTGSFVLALGVGRLLKRSRLAQEAMHGLFGTEER